MKVVDIAGERYGRLVALERAGSTSSGRALWLCQCDCGKSSVADGRNLRAGRVRSCGCLRLEAAHANGLATGPTNIVAAQRAIRRHGQSGSGDGRRAPGPEYQSWSAMKQRCLNPKATGYDAYGALGITICDRWRKSFEAFLEDMGERPDGTSLDRIDPDGNYEPGNCRWATPLEQRHNWRSSVAA